jgi:hypothetical protein
MMVSLGRRHIAFEPEFDLSKWGMFGGFSYPGNTGFIHVRRIGRIVWMTLPKGKRV